jgi:hypothetical protein
VSHSLSDRDIFEAGMLISDASRTVYEFVVSFISCSFQQAW